MSTIQYAGRNHSYQVDANGIVTLSLDGLPAYCPPSLAIAIRELEQSKQWVAGGNVERRSFPSLRSRRR